MDWMLAAIALTQTLLISAAACAAVAAVAALFLIGHVRTWRALAGRADLSERDRRYFARQYRRRMQTSSMMALIAVGLFVGLNFIDWRRHPSVFVFFWSGLTVLVVWMAVLAAIDFGSIRRRFASRAPHGLPTTPQALGPRHDRASAGGNGRLQA